MRRVLFVCILLAACKTIPPVDPPEFDYPGLARLAETAPGRTIPLTIQRGANLHPVSSQTGFLFYSSNRDGSGDIWMRDLHNTVAFPVIKHPAEQGKPAVPLNGQKLAFVSFDTDAGGDIRIVEIKPDSIIKDSLAGSTPPNLWDSSDSLSEQVVQASKQLPPACRGAFAETDPVFSGDGKYLYYVSDRCTPGTFNIWRIELKGIDLKGTPEIISQKGGVQPALSYDGKRITYVSYRSGHAEIYVQDLQTRQEILVRTGGGILQYPALSPDGAIVFYIAVREDTNQNGSLDAMDKAGIYSAPVAGGREARLVDPSTSLHGLYFSLFLGGTLLYSAESYQNISVYFVRPEGVIPRQADIEEQYLFASRFLREPGKRTIALDALERFFGGTKEFILYEGKYLQSRVDTLIGDERKAAEEELKEARARNPFAEYQLTLAALPRQKSRVEFIQEFLKKTESSDLQNEQRTLIVPAVLDDLSKAQESEGDKPGALESLVRIDKEFPTYYRRARIRLREAVLELKVTGKIPAVAMEELQAKPSIQRREEILTEIVNYFGRIRKPDDLDAAVSKELERADLIPLIRSTLEYLRARSLYDRGRDEEALTLARNLQTGLPQESGMYVRTWQLLAFLFERRRDYAGAYEARLRYGGAYRPDTGVKIGLDEYREILEQSDRTIKRTLASARSIAAVVDEQDAVISRTLLSRTLEGTPVQTLLNQVRQNPIELSASDREALHDLCFGNTGAIIGNLGKPEYVKTFVQFCKDAEPYLKGKNEGGMNLEFARTGSDLLYLVSYSNVNILNILFYNMKRVNLFEKFHEENSIKYHRLKVDIAMERNRNRIEWDRRQVAILDPRNVIDLFSEGDPFDATSFNEVVHGYKFAATEARSVGELSFVYGYAYALIQKSVERDRFYDRSAKEGITIPEDVRRAKKQDTLRDLKTAEYLLQYILFVKPDNADAYLQLGWLYQYIDDRRSRNIPTAETFVVRVVNYLTRTSAPRATDGQYYIDIYRAYFPDRLYENNVELYRQAIQLIGFLNSTDPALPDLHLNLANNYFQLLNFKKAIDHFNQNEDLRRAVGGASDPVRTGLFYFNRGRAYYYEGQTTSASRDLKKALEMYTSSDLSPAEELVEGIRFRITDVGEKSENMARLKVRLEDGQKRLDNARLRVAMIGALYALSLYESGRYAESSRAYETADAQIRRMQEPANELRAGILNFLALARQNQSRIESSDIQAIASRDLSKEIGLSRQDARYQPQSIGGRLLGCLLTYGEDFSVIGEGRNPYGLAPLRQYELSLGILLENRILAGDRSGAFEILSQRREIFDGKDGDVNLGRIGLITADNQRAYEEFLSGHYESAQKLFATAGENARAHGFLDQARRNYINRYQALFALFESGDDALPRMKGALADLDEFRSVYREKAKEEYISQKQTEDPAFEYEPAIDDPILESQLTRRLQDFVVVEANLHYYSGYSLDRRATSPADLTQARAHYTKALELYDRLIAGQQDEATSPVHFRVRLNRGVILSRLGRIEQAMNVLSRMIEELEEFALSGEEWFARRALANLAAARFFERGRPSDAALAREQYIRAAEILTEDPTVRKGLIGMQEFYEDAADFFASSGDPQKANQLLEQSWVYALQEDYLRYPISFESTALTETYEKYLSASRTARALAVREQSLRFGRKDSKVAREEKMRALASLETARESMRSAVPLHEAFLSSPVSSPDLRKGQWMIRLFYRGHTLSVFAFLPGFAYYREDGNPEAALKTILNRLPRRVPSALLVIADQETWSLNLEAAIQSARPDLPVPLFVTRMSDPGVLYSEIRPELNQFNTLDANSDFEASDVFIVEREFADDFFAIENGRFQARQFLQKRHNASMAVTDEPSRNFNKIRTAYELFRAGGVGSLVIRQSKGPLPAQNQKLTGQGFRVMGSEGFRTD
ncbi:MAG TPA: tetratricopeptide repeat protein, partial [Leptospiraceae bacterium]|nr:tetratricopeptide repeat protein [Leptospiraceae bacterium]